mgnify:CR=1 FL=1
MKSGVVDLAGDLVEQVEDAFDGSDEEVESV